jgi:hypothetical protein
MILVTGGTGAIGAVPRSKDVACLTVVPSELVVRPARRLGDSGTPGRILHGPAGRARHSLAGRGF